jgi:hypothetical protein
MLMQEQIFSAQVRRGRLWSCILSELVFSIALLSFGVFFLQRYDSSFWSPPVVVVLLAVTCFPVLARAVRDGLRLIKGRDPFFWQLTLSERGLTVTHWRAPAPKREPEWGTCLRWQDIRSIELLRRETGGFHDSFVDVSQAGSGRKSLSLPLSDFPADQAQLFVDALKHYKPDAEDPWEKQRARYEA